MASEVLTTEVKGNTKPLTSEPKSRNFQITINQIDKYNDILSYLTNLKSLQYLISCKELAPSTEHEHIHIYIHFNKSIKLSIKKLLGAHLEKCFGSIQQNINYIKKDGNILDEIGEPPHQGKPNYNFDELNNLSTKDIINNDEINLIQKKTLLNIKKELCNQPININDYYKGDNLKVYYLYGPSGIGKTKRALKIIKNYGYNEFDEIKHKNGFYLGISGNSKVCLYDDFRPSHMEVSEFINFIDYNKHNLNTKGGNFKNNYELIIITSINNPYDIYSNCTDNEETKTQWIRRLHIINMEDEEDEYDNIDIDKLIKDKDGEESEDHFYWTSLYGTDDYI